MKKLVTILLVFAAVGMQCTNAQQQNNISAQNQISKTFQEFVESMKKENVEEQLDYYYPQIFDFFPKDSFLVALKMMREMPNMEKKPMNINSISDIHTANSFKYALLSVSEEISINISEQLKEGGMDYALTLLLNEYKRLLGDENVNYDNESQIIELNATYEYYAIMDPEIKEWKFILVDETSSNALKEIIPQEIRSKE